MRKIQKVITITSLALALTGLISCKPVTLNGSGPASGSGSGSGSNGSSKDTPKNPEVLEGTKGGAENPKDQLHDLTFSYEDSTNLKYVFKTNGTAEYISFGDVDSIYEYSISDDGKYYYLRKTAYQYRTNDTVYNYKSINEYINNRSAIVQEALSKIQQLDPNNYEHELYLLSFKYNVRELPDKYAELPQQEMAEYFADELIYDINTNFIPTLKRYLNAIVRFEFIQDPENSNKFIMKDSIPENYSAYELLNLYNFNGHFHGDYFNEEDKEDFVDCDINTYYNFLSTYDKFYKIKSVSKEYITVYNDENPSEILKLPYTSTGSGNDMQITITYKNHPVTLTYWPNDIELTKITE